MPIYRCECPGCGERHESFARIAEREQIRCPRCGAWKQNRIPCVTSLKREWQGKDARSWQFNVDPEAARRGEFAKDLPSWEFGPDGHALFRGDSHQKRCFREFHQAKARLEEEDARAPAMPEKA